MTLLKCAQFYGNGHASLHVFNNKFYGVNSPILHKTLKMAFLVDNLIINKSLSTLHNYNITNNILYVHT